MAEILDFPNKKNEDPAKKERRNRIKTSLSLLPQYRGEVISKNNMRSLPGLKPGEIFWVEMEGCGYVVASVSPANKGKTRVVIKKLDETATVSTGMTIFDMNQNIIAKEPLFNWEDVDAVDKLTADMKGWLDESGNKYYLLYGRDIHYVTVFDHSEAADNQNFAVELKDVLKSVGDIISFDFNTMEGPPSVEIWVRTGTSDAELLYLMPYDKGIVKI